MIINASIAHFGFQKKNYFLPSLSIRDPVIEDKLHVCVGYWDILNQICLHFILFNFLIWFLGTKINGLCCVNLPVHRPLFHPWDKAEGQIFHFDLCTLYLDTYLLLCCEPDNKNKHACKSTCISYSSKIKTIYMHSFSTHLSTGKWWGLHRGVKFG